MTEPYRRTIELDRKTDYWWVEAGPLDLRASRAGDAERSGSAASALNDGGSWPFPSESAAVRFATSHKQTAQLQYGVDRAISIRYPDGRTVDITLGDVEDVLEPV